MAIFNIHGTSVISFEDESRVVTFRQLNYHSRSLQIINLLRYRDIERLYKKVKFHDMPAETLVVKQGSTTNSVYILFSGNAAAHYSDKYNNRLYLAKFKRGDFFGEAAFFTEGTRTATIHTTTRSKVIEIEAPVLKDLMDRYPKIYDLMYTSFKERRAGLKAKVMESLKRLRKRKRVEIEGEAKFQLAGIGVKKQSAQFGLLQNLSHGGCKIEMDGDQFEAFKKNIVGRKVPVSITLAGSKETVSAIGQVSWYEQATGLEIFGYRIYFGMRFIKINNESLDVLDGLQKVER